VIVDRTTLQPDLAHVYATDAACPIERLADTLNRVKDSELAILSGAGGLATTSSTSTEAQMTVARGKLGDAVKRLGGTRDTVVRLATGQAYSLIGRPGLKEGTADEASPVLSPGMSSSRITGTLTRPNGNAYDLSTVNYATAPDARPSTNVTDLLYQPTEAWPLYDTAGHKNALGWVEGRVDNGGNLRTDYWRQGWSDAVWSAKKTDIAGLTFPADAEGFTAADLADVKAQLGQEISWLLNVRSYFSRLGAPYTDGALASVTELQRIADTVSNGVQVQPDLSMTIPILSFLAELGGLGTSAAGFSPYAAAFRPLGLIANVMKTGVAITRLSGGKPITDAEFKTKVAEAGVNLANGFLRSKDALARMQAIVAGDYGKLRKLGSLGDCSQSSASCPAEWQLPQSTEAFARSMLILQTKQAIYQSLLSLKFQADVLNPATGREANAAAWVCGRWFRYGDFERFYEDHRFGHEPEGGYVQLKYVSGNDVLHDTIAMRVRNGDTGRDFEYQQPTADLMDPLFKPADLTNPAGGNLGLIKSRFYLQTWGTVKPNFGCASR
jgi:hypothetical protein